MSWTMYRWVWQLKSPLHIGWLPAGALNRTRLYIPARTLWGALTAELARNQNSDFPDYVAVGQKLLQYARFSYLFPAEHEYGEWKAWLPRYQEGMGLAWYREDHPRPEQKRDAQQDKAQDWNRDKSNVKAKRSFRMCLLSTRFGTAIETRSDTAAEGTLREFELIHLYWRGEGSLPRPVAMVGYLFCRNAELERRLKNIREIFVGGDTRYGLGHLQRVFLNKANDFFGTPVELNDTSPAVRTDRVLAHTLPHRLNLLGNQECFAGWDMAYGGLKAGGITWAPGSSCSDEQEYTIRNDGLWEAKAG